MYFNSLADYIRKYSLDFQYKRISEFKVMEGFPMSPQSVLFTLRSLFCHLAIFHGVTGSPASAPKSIKPSVNMTFHFIVLSQLFCSPFVKNT